ncbi:eukaryotic translation initiation factor 4 gamma-like isoform X2 [Teleopsis dalmanni]|uniref:eukaryotic translation initiation factor 4 gamma-like isoform X2 n=1 Tax=Teleopsis dalmanni TaxID=139649 RepID=UPI0018CDF7CA|nr:eukaryotic translation initiation factor 4 gamma-like isoform X2 [Teleopsis dalmanni]
MLHQAGGGGKGNRPAQQQPQQLNQHQLTISQLQLHPGQQALHQANQTGHSIHAVQQQQLSSAPLHLGHQTQTQNLSHYQHPQQNQQQAPQPQLAHPSQSFLILNQPPPLPQSNNGTPGPQLASSPPLQNSSTPHTTTQSGGQIQCYGNNNSINHTNNTGNIGRQQSATNNTGNIQYAGNTNIIPAHGPGFMTTTFHMPYQQAPPPASVMAATIYANNAAPVGNHNANTTQNTSQQALFTAAQHQPQQPHGMPPAQALQYFPGNISVPNTQMRGVLTHRSYVMPPFFAFPTGPRAQLLSNSHQQPGVGQVLQTATRGPMGTTTAYIQPYCQPPIPMCTPQSPIIPQPPTASSSLQTYSTHMQASNAIGAASSSNTSINSLNSNTEIVKPRKHAIPIINPDTMVSIFEEKPRRQSTSTETSPDTLKKSKDDSGINIEENTIASDSLLTSTEQTEASLLADSSADDYEQHLQNELSVDSNMNQTSYEEKSTFTVSSSPAVSNISATEEEYDDNTSICSQTTSNTKLNSDKQTEDYTIEFEDEHITVVVEEVPVESSTNIVEDEVDNICSFSDVESDAPVKNKLLNNDEIVAKYLQPDLNATQGEADHNYEFLNKSVSPGEDEEELSARLLLHEQQYAMDTHAELKAIRFGDFSEDKDSDELSETKSIIDNTTNAVFSNIKNNMPTSAEYNRNRNSSDVTINDKIIKRNLEFKIGFGRVEGGADKPLQTNISYKSDGTTKSLTRYSMDELRTISKSAQSRKPPVINFPPGSCISQLFVSRHNHSNNQHQSNNMHQHVHQQQYQHMNFNESIEFLSGKRRTQNKKHDNTSNSANSHATSSSSMNSQNQRKMDIIHVNLSLNEEIKLSECENAWQPDSIRSKSIKSHSSPNDDIDAVLKKVRGVLNKLTPDNFDVLLKSMSNISIDTQEKMHQVIILIFEKTISEPNFAPTYAKFCKVLFHETTIDSKALITRIQNEFETNVNDAHAKKLKLQPLVEKLEKCEDPKERIELQAEIENQEYQFRRRAWGTVRFIGEIYKLQSLGSDRVLICIESLLEHGSEEKLEYMCKLLTTVGHLLEGKATEHKLRLDKIFRKINDIVNKSRNNNNNKKQEKISSRVRFMMQDVMDLRARNWDQPYTDKQRRTPTKQQQQQHLTEKVQNKSNATNLINSNRSVGYNSQNNSRHSRGIDNQRDNNYFASNKQKLNYVQQNEQIDMNKLKFTRNEDTTLGCSSMCLWKIHGRAPTSVNTNSTTLTNNASTSASASGSTHTTDSNVRRTTNPFQILDNLDNNRTTSQSSVGSSCSSTNSSNCGYNNKECQRIINGLVEEILDGNSGWGQEVLNIWQTANRFQQTSLLQYILIEYLHLADTKRTQREACAKIFIHLIPNKKIFDKKVFTTAYNEFAEEFPDLLVDVPNGWSYIFEFLGSILHERLLHLDDIWNSQWDNNGPKFAERFLKALVVYFTNEFGANYMYDMWHKEFKLDRAQRFFSDESDWDRFIKANSFQYIAERNYKIPQAVRVNKSHNITTAEQVERIEYLLNTANECDLAIDYINTNVIINSTFIKNLTKCLCCDFSTVIQTNNNNTSSGTATSSITTSNTPKKTKKSQHKRQLNTELFRSKCTPLLRLCIDMREEYEIACLDAIVDALQQAYEDSTTANDLICSVFEILYESEIIPKDSYEKWYQIRKSAGASTSSPTNSNIRSGTNKEKDKNAGSNRQAHNKQQHTNNNSKNRNNRLSDEIYTYIKKLL